MKLEAQVELDWQGEKFADEVLLAATASLRDLVVLVAADSVEHSPVKYGNNRRSICFGLSGEEHSQASPEGHQSGDTHTGPNPSVLTDTGLVGAVYSTSGYGGFLETGTSKMPARPYMYPALQKHFTQENFAERMRRHLK